MVIVNLWALGFVVVTDITALTSGFPETKTRLKLSIYKRETNDKETKNDQIDTNDKQVLIGGGNEWYGM